MTQNTLALASLLSSDTAGLLYKDDGHALMQDAHAHLCRAIGSLTVLEAELSVIAHHPLGMVALRNVLAGLRLCKDNMASAIECGHTLSSNPSTLPESHV